MGISTDFERESILIQDCCHEWRWVFSSVLPKSNGLSTSPAPAGRELLRCKPELREHMEAQHRCFTHWYVIGKGEEAVCVLSELWCLSYELNGLSINVPWEGLCSQVSCSNAVIAFTENITLPKGGKVCTFTRGQFLCIDWCRNFKFIDSLGPFREYQKIFKGNLLFRQAFMGTHFETAVSTEDN